MNTEREFQAEGVTWWATGFFVIGLAFAVFLHWPALTNHFYYKSDVRQSPHWAAYHTDSFQENDLLVTLGAHNESPLMNGIYFVGTMFTDVVRLGKILAVVGFGLSCALFFIVARRLFELRTAILVATCYTFLPDQFVYFAGGFSKAWMIPILLVCVYLLETRRWKQFLWLMPFGALAYPVSAVLTGAVFFAFILLEWPEQRKKVFPAFRMLCASSALALAVLFVKYLFPPEGIGSLTSSSLLFEMPEMYRGGMWPYLPLPSLAEELAEYVTHPFVVGSAVVFLVCLGRKRIWWSRSLTALVIASLVFYVTAETFFMHLYQPNRYTRYSVAVLFAFWHGVNWIRVADRVPWRSLKVAVLVIALGLGAFWYRDSYRPGKDASPRGEWVALNFFLGTQPKKILVAGHPKYMDDIPILSRRSVLCNYKMAHPWYSEFYPEIKRRTEATFDAYYATEIETVNRLHEEWGVTHLVVVKKMIDQEQALDRDIYVDPYNDYIATIAARSESYLLQEPPKESLLYEDDEICVLQLPLRSGNAAGDQGAEPSGETDR